MFAYKAKEFRTIITQQQQQKQIEQLKVEKLTNVNNMNMIMNLFCSIQLSVV